MSDSVLAIRGLSLSFDTDQGPVHALRQIDLEIPRGQITGVVGESGSGKSTLALAIMGLLPGNARITSGTMRFCGTDLALLSEDEMRGMRGTRMSMVFQDPMTSLNPVRGIGRQMTDIQYRDAAANHSRRVRCGIGDSVRVQWRAFYRISGTFRLASILWFDRRGIVFYL